MSSSDDVSADTRQQPGKGADDDRPAVEDDATDSGSDSESEVPQPQEDKPKKKNKRPWFGKRWWKKFQQQKLPAWQPILRPWPVIFALLVASVLFFAIGGVLLWSAITTRQIVKRYDDHPGCRRTCPDLAAANCTCLLPLHVGHRLKKPVYFYYRLEGFYQNHRRYAASRNDDQLGGDVLKSYSDTEECAPRRSANHSHRASAIYVPCGAIALSTFNDSFTMFKPSGGTVNWKTRGIAWESDIDTKFKNPRNGSVGTRSLDRTLFPRQIEDQQFMVWMRVAALPNFNKLHRIIDDDLPAGNYTIQIENRYPVRKFSGRKYIVISEVSWMGGRNLFLGIAFPAVAAIMLLAAFLFAAVQIIHPRKLGDPKYLKWNKKK